MNLNNIHNIYFIGIGGIGMSAIARFFKSQNKNVAGYDKTQTEITDSLEALGISVHFKDKMASVENSYLNKENTLVVYTPAIPKDHKQLNYFKSNGFKILKRSEILGIITVNTFCLAVAGTHGKTTTTSMLSWVLEYAKKTQGYVMGGVRENVGV